MRGDRFPLLCKILGTLGLPAEAIDDIIERILDWLKRPSDSDALQACYLDFRQRHGQRPTATELFHEGYTPRSLRTTHGSWLLFVKAMGDLSPPHQAALAQAADFLASLEITQMTKSFKMLTLLAMLNEDALPGDISIESLAESFGRLAGRSAIRAGLAAIVRPLEGHLTSGVELAEQVLEERANCVDAPVVGVQPQARVFLHDVGVDLEAPVFGVLLKLGGKLPLGFIALVEAAGLHGKVEGVGLRRLIGQAELETEVGEVIGHGDVLRVEC